MFVYTHFNDSLCKKENPALSLCCGHITPISLCSLVRPACLVVGSWEISQEKAGG